MKDEGGRMNYRAAASTQTLGASISAMIRLSQNASDQEILDAVRQWVTALAREDFDSAYAMTFHEPDDAWTPQIIKAAVMQYGGPEPPENWGTYHACHCGAYREYYEGLLQTGMREEMARLAVARKLSATVLAVWKSGRASTQGGS